MRPVSASTEETHSPDCLTDIMVDKLDNLSTSSNLDFSETVNQVMTELGAVM
jgi:hypothetical protein